MAVFWTIALGLVMLFCLTRALQDFRQKRYVWAAAGLLSGAVILLVPFPNLSVEVTLPELSQTS